MRRSARAFLAFTAFFAVLVGFVFWGTWSPDVAPVMPDFPIVHRSGSFLRYLAHWRATGGFIPTDLRHLFSPYLFQELTYAICLYFAALGMAYFCRGHGLSRLASYGAGLLLAFSGYWMTLFSAGHQGWFLWMPYGVFAFGLVDRAVAKGKPRHWLLLGATLAWASFNQQDIWLLFTLFTAAYFVFLCCRARVFPLKGVLLAAAVFALVGLPNFVQSLTVTLASRKEQVAMNAPRADAADRKDAAAPSTGDARWEFVTNWSMPPEDALEFFWPRVHGDTSCPICLSLGPRQGKDLKPYVGRLGRPLNAPRGNYRQHSLYVGWVSCLLALAGLVSAFRVKAPVRRAGILFFAGAALVFFILSLGRFCAPAYRVVFALPFGDLIRCPVKWHHLTEFALVALAAYGIDALQRACRAWPRARWALAALVALVAFGALDLAVQDRRFCVPVSVAAARQKGLDMQTAVLRRADFANPRLAQAVRRGDVISFANYLGDPDLFLVGVLQPFSKEDPPTPAPWALPLGILSLLATLAVAAYGIRTS